MMKSSDAGNRTLLTGQRKSKKTIAGSVAFVFFKWLGSVTKRFTISCFRKVRVKKLYEP